MKDSSPQKLTRENVDPRIRSLYKKVEIGAFITDVLDYRPRRAVLSVLCGLVLEIATVPLYNRAIQPVLNMDESRFGPALVAATVDIEEGESIAKENVSNNPDLFYAPEKRFDEASQEEPISVIGSEKAISSLNDRLGKVADDMVKKDSYTITFKDAHSLAKERLRSKGPIPFGYHYVGLCLAAVYVAASWLNKKCKKSAHLSEKITAKYPHIDTLTPAEEKSSLEGTLSLPSSL